MADETGEARYPRRGAVMVAHGDAYRALAAACARYLKMSNPDLAVHLFTDERVASDDIDEQFLLDDVWVRSKIDGLLQTRFEQTLYIDVDAFCILDISDAFDVLERYDFAVCHDQWRNHPLTTRTFRKEITAAFPQFNGGLFFYRRSPEVMAFLRDWRDALKETGSKTDQPALRELLYESDLRFFVLPPEYNLHKMSVFRPFVFHAAPRVIHVNQFHRDPSFVASGCPIFMFLGPGNYLDLLRWVGQDQRVVNSGTIPKFATEFEGWSRRRALATLYLKHRALRMTGVWRRLIEAFVPKSLNLI